MTTIGDMFFSSHFFHYFSSFFLSYFLSFFFYIFIMMIFICFIYLFIYFFLDDVPKQKKLYTVPESQINIIDNNDISANATIQTKMYALYKWQSKQQKQTLVSQVKIKIFKKKCLANRKKKKEKSYPQEGALKWAGNSNISSRHIKSTIVVTNFKITYVTRIHYWNKSRKHSSIPMSQHNRKKTKETKSIQGT